jgi:hypothetical protein
MSEDSERLEARIEALEREVAALKQRAIPRSVRRRSPESIFGLPLYEVATGPDLERNESRGHARAIIAIGDIATGIVAIGGLARGVVALEGMAIGVIALGGVSIGILLGIGGLAIGAIAGGGGAIGVVAIGGGAIGYYACGGGAFGKYVISAMQQDPEAVRFFGPWVSQLLGVNPLPPPPGR